MGFISAVEDIYLKRHVKQKVKEYYLLQGIKIPDLEHKTLKELFDLVNKIYNELLVEKNGLILRNTALHEIIEKSELKNKELSKENTLLRSQNNMLMEKIEKNQISHTDDNVIDIKNKTNNKKLITENKECLEL